MKQISELKVIERKTAATDCLEFTLEPYNGKPLPEIFPGQFINVMPPGGGLLRRPISVGGFSRAENNLKIYVQRVGRGSDLICNAKIGDNLNAVLPLGNTFPLKQLSQKRLLLIGGGVGIAPLSFYADWLTENKIDFSFVAGARSAERLLKVHSESYWSHENIYTEDGSAGMKGLITASPQFYNSAYDFWVCCGPRGMMRAVVELARQRNQECYVSLENSMACGIGACLCCIEKTTRGNKCVCTEGPVFNINDLTW